MAIEFAGAVTATSTMTTITGGSAGVMGAWTELITSTARESYIFTLSVSSPTADANITVHVGTGSTPSEVFSAVFWANTDLTNEALKLTFTVASGEKVSLAITSTDASTTAIASISLSDDDSYGTSTQATLIGASGGQGTDIDPGVTPNTPGSWTELVASCPHDMSELWMFVGQSNNNGIGGVYRWLIDIAVHPTAPTSALVESLYHVEQATEAGSAWHPLPPGLFATGDRVWVRAQSNTNDAADRIIDVSILGSDVIAPTGGGGAVEHSYAY